MGRTLSGDPGATARLLRERAHSGDLWIPVSGTSMGRRYRSGSRVRVSACDRAPRCGQVWVFCRRDGVVLAHRFLARRGDRYVFRGDAEPRADLAVREEWLVGIVTAVDDGVRRWRPRAWHAVRPVVRAALRRCVRVACRAVRFGATSSRGQG